jgi:polysaccharide export outer membrane protein
MPPLRLTSAGFFRSRGRIGSAVRAVLACACLLAWTLPASAGQASYIIGPQDVLVVSVFNQPNLSGKYVVETDGTFTFPLLGRVKVGGSTLREAGETLTKLLMQGWLKRPQVTVTVDQYRSQQIFVVGEIRQPGEYTLSGETTLLAALARAGSASPEASGEVMVVRPAAGAARSGPVLPNDAGGADVIRVDLAKLQSGDLTQNVQLRDGDTVYLPRGEKVFVYGHVRAPGAYAIQKEMTVLQALTVAGGVTERGALNRVRIARMVDGERKEIKAKVGDRVQPGDTIIVPERYF